MHETITMPTERRKHTRTQLQMTLRSIRLDPECGDVIDCLHMVNISRSGLGAVSDRSFYPGQRVVLCLPLPNGLGRKNVYAKIVRCQQNHQAYTIGLEFEHLPVGSWCGINGAVAAA
jgi:hypothetical protein